MRSLVVYATIVLLAGLLLFFGFGFAAIALYSYGSELIGGVVTGIILSVISMLISLTGLLLLVRKVTFQSPRQEAGQQSNMSQVQYWIQNQPYGSVCMAFASGWIFENLPSRVKSEVTQHLDYKLLTDLIEKEFNLEKEETEISK